VIDTIIALLDWPLAIATVAVAAAGFMRGFVGFGAALMTVPVFAWLFGPLVAVPVSTVVGVASTIALLPTAIAQSERPVVVPIAIGVFLMAPLGTWLLVSLDEDLMRIIISTLVVVMVVMLGFGWKLQGRVPTAVLLSAGGAAGLVQGAAGIGGPPVVAVALSRPGSAASQRANVLGVMTAVSIAGIPPLAWLGLYSVDVIVIGILLMPTNYLFTQLGARYFLGSGAQHYRLVALGVLALVGASTLINAVRDYSLT
jgi:uncharacterized membrane protein YfcA